MALEVIRGEGKTLEELPTIQEIGASDLMLVESKAGGTKSVKFEDVVSNASTQIGIPTLKQDVTKLKESVESESGWKNLTIDSGISFRLVGAGTSLPIPSSARAKVMYKTKTIGQEEYLLEVVIGVNAQFTSRYDFRNEAFYRIDVPLAVEGEPGFYSCVSNGRMWVEDISGGGTLSEMDFNTISVTLSSNTVTIRGKASARMTSDSYILFADVRAIVL